MDVEGGFETYTILVLILVAVLIGAIIFLLWSRPPVYNYVHYPGKSIAGQDLYGLPKDYTLTDYKRICNTDPKCKAFLGSGWVKSNVPPQSEWKDNPESSIYVKGGRDYWAGIWR